MTDAAAELRGWTCHAPDARIARMTEIVMGAINPDHIARVLDIGCGAGAQVRELARRLPHASFTGIDLSPLNVAAAEAARRDHPAAARMTFVTADYLSLTSAQPYDLVVSDGVLHLIAGSDRRVAEKLASDVAPGGTLVIAMATETRYNRWFARVRRMLRAIRTSASDQAILTVARWLHGNQMTDAMLVERIPYMYLPPTRLMGAGFRDVLAAHGFDFQVSYPLTSTSWSQLTHAVSVFARVPDRRAA